MTKKAAHPNAEHPLFPIPVDAQDVDLSERDITFIYVSRGGETARKRLASDLLDEEQLFEEYGGGHFILKARNQANSRWTATREVRLAGPSKPLNPEAAAPPAAPAQPTTPNFEVSSSAVRDGLAIASVLGPLFLQWADTSARRSEAQTNLLIQLVGGRNQGPNDQLVNLMAQAAFNRNPAQEQFALIQQAMQMGAQMGARGGDDDGDMFDKFNDGFANFVELQKVNAAKRQNQAPPSPPAGEPK